MLGKSSKALMVHHVQRSIYSAHSTGKEDFSHIVGGKILLSRIFLVIWN